MEGLTLTTLRESKQMKIADIIASAQCVDPTFPSSHAGYLGIEEKGTRDYWKIRALSSVFDVEMTLLAEVLKPSSLRKKCSEKLQYRLHCV